MLEFDQSYFRREERGSHLVGELVKKAWAVQLDILSKIDSICQKYGITYFAYWGTLLGAVRHQGFIPWDDDMDIAMLRPDYTRFLEVIEGELPEEFHVINNYSDSWKNNFTRITNRREILLSGEKIKENYNFPFALGIDIFPLDYISSDKREAEEQKQILRYIGILVGMLEKKEMLEKQGESLEKIQEYSYAIAENLVQIEKLCGIHFESELPLSKQLNILYDQISALFTEEESEYVTDFPAFFRTGYNIEKSCYKEFNRVPFENITIPIPNGYDKILRRTYSDYMVPRKGSSTHGELCFKKQIELFANELDRMALTEFSEKYEAEFMKEISKKLVNEPKKKVIFLHNSTLETIANDTKVIGKLKKIFSYAKQNPDVLIWWRPSRIDLEQMNVVQKMLPQMCEEYKMLIDNFQSEEMGIFDPGISMRRVLEVCDAYYGDNNKISKVFQLVHKPVMIIDYHL